MPMPKSAILAREILARSGWQGSVPLDRRQKAQLKGWIAVQHRVSWVPFIDLHVQTGWAWGDYSIPNSYAYRDLNKFFF